MSESPHVDGLSSGTGPARRGRDAAPRRALAAEILPLLLMPATPALPAPASWLALLVLAALWWRARDRRVGPGPALLAIGVAVLSLALAATPLGLRWSAAPAEDSGREYAALWEGFDRLAERAAADLAAIDPEGSGTSPFATLSALVDDAAPARRDALLVLDARREVVAWAGAGLLHDLDPDRLPQRGRTYRASFSSATLLAIEPIASRPGWQVVAGRSFPADLLPFPTPRRWAGRALRWTLAPSRAAVPDDLVALEVPGTPTLVVDLGDAEPREETGLGGRHLAWVCLGLLLAGLGLARVRRRPGGPADPRPDWAAALLIVGGVWSLAMARGLAPLWAGLLAAALAFYFATLRWSYRPRQGWGAALAGAAVVLAAGGLAFALQWWAGPIDLGRSLVPAPPGIGLRLVLFLVTLGLFGTIGARRAHPTGEARWAWLAFVLLLATAALHDRPAWACAGLLTGGAAVGTWLARTTRPRSLAPLGAMLLVSMLVSATTWETVFRHLLRTHAATSVLAAIAPPADAELDRAGAEIDDYFEGRDLRDFAPLGPEGLDRQDLAFEIWHHTPLARDGTLSALVVWPIDGEASRFSFGLPIDEEGEVDWSPSRWAGGEPPFRDDSVIVGEADLYRGDEVWAVARYWLALRPGFRLAGRPIGNLAAGLLRGGPVATTPDGGQIGPVLYALYGKDRMLASSPWEGAPPMAPDVAAGGQGTVPTYAGRTTALVAEEPGGSRVLYLPALPAGAALERVGTHVLGVFGGVLLALLLVLPFLVVRADVRRALSRAIRSYSARLVIVYSMLLLLPLAVMNVAVLRILGERLEREQQAGGLAALESAQQVLGEYVLSLEPGFGLDIALDDELLSWLSGVVHHEVNLYWRGSVYASSKPELFTAGLLPERIPGEIYTRLTLLGHPSASRVNQVGGSDYLELYAPLKIPGISVEQSRLFLSVPLLAQEEETSAEIASLRRQALLGTTVLLLLLVAIGTRFARGFTEPLEAIVRGTRRIAAGETSLELAPRELELATLVEAIDRMAEKIAEGRRRLLQEKRVVDRVVESITSGVVSLDREHRVLMHNRVAAELLGVKVGESLDEALARQERLAPVLEFCAEPGLRPERRTLGLEDADGEEREWSLVRVPMPGEGEPTALVVVEDVTEVLRGQRLQAWAEMARIIAHEIKNPLTPIRLSTEHMVRVRESDPAHFDAVFESCTTNILKQVDELQEISSEFSIYSRLPRIDLEPGDLAELVEEVVGGYRTAPPAGVTVSFDAERRPIEGRFDAKLLGRAVRNLVENAIRATAGGGEVAVSVGASNGAARISVRDSGPGVEADNLARIFEPYFSTHDSGTGLGLPIARRVAEEHGGHIAARNRAEGGLEVTISLSVAGG